MDHGEPDHRLPPRREQLPLPRRDGQTHLEPQLREPGGTGTGTPFAAFDGGAGPDGSPADGSPADDAPADDAPADDAPSDAGPAGSEAPTGNGTYVGTGPRESRAGAFRAAVRRATDRPSRRTG